MKYSLITVVTILSLSACGTDAETLCEDTLAGCETTEERPCGELFFEDDGCACYAAAEGWCLGYHTDTTPPNKGECEADEGVELTSCPTDMLVGKCSENDDFHSPSVSLYENYTGGLDSYPELDTAPETCDSDGLYSWYAASI